MKNSQLQFPHFLFKMVTFWRYKKQTCVFEEENTLWPLCHFSMVIKYEKLVFSIKEKKLQYCDYLLCNCSLKSKRGMCFLTGLINSFACRHAKKQATLLSLLSESHSKNDNVVVYNSSFSNFWNAALCNLNKEPQDIIIWIWAHLSHTLLNQLYHHTHLRFGFKRIAKYPLNCQTD